MATTATTRATTCVDPAHTFKPTLHLAFELGVSTWKLGFTNDPMAPDARALSQSVVIRSADGASRRALVMESDRHPDHDRLVQVVCDWFHRPFRAMGYAVEPRR